MSQLGPMTTLPPLGPAVDHIAGSVDVLFENQRMLDERSLVGYARAVGMGEPLIEEALGDRFEAAVRRDIRGGVHSGVHGTPYLFLNGDRFDGRVTSAVLLQAFTASARRQGSSLSWA